MNLNFFIVCMYHQGLQISNFQGQKSMEQIWRLIPICEDFHFDERFIDHFLVLMLNLQFECTRQF